MEKIGKLPWYVAIIAAIALGAICHIAFGWKFAPIVVVVALIWLSARTTPWLITIAVAIVVWLMFTSYFPQLSSKGPFSIMAADVYAASKIDSVQIKANDILEMEKNRQKQKMLPKYTELLKAGRVKEAQALLDSIDQLFTIERHEAEVSASNRSDNSITVLPMGSTTIPMLVNPGDESGWYKFPELCVKGEYSFKSPDNGFEVFFSDGSGPYPGASSIPHKKDPVFKFRALKPNQAITITAVVTR